MKRYEEKIFMRVMLTSCGQETEQIREQFLIMLGKEPADTAREAHIF